MYHSQLWNKKLKKFVTIAKFKIASSVHNEPLTICLTNMGNAIFTFSAHNNIKNNYHLSSPIIEKWKAFIMGYVNIFQKLDQNIAEQLEELQTQQQELLEKKKKLLSTKQEIQKFLNSAQEIKKLVASEPELLKSLRAELGQIFAINNNNTPKVPRKKIDNSKANLEPKSVSPPSTTKSINLEEESISDFNFVDAQGKNKSVNPELKTQKAEE